MAQLCPDRQLLSVYFDGEMPSPWKEKMEAHIAGCPRCARQLETYRRISPGMAAAADEGAAEAVKERVWRKLEQRTGSTAWPTVWRRRITVPLPAAAAVVVLFIVLAFVMVLKMGTAESPGMTLASETDFDAPDIIPASDMEDVLQYLGNRDNGEIIILHLPESRNFVNYGEPAIVKAADYSRQTMGRQTPGWRKP
jgi:anti-sigma factor RsiW